MSKQEQASKRLDFIGIDEDIIYGIKNPMLTISGTILEEDYMFELIVDGEKQDYNLVSVGNHFTITTSLNKSAKLIRLFVEVDDKKYFVCARNNNTLSRIKMKLVALLKKVITKTKTLSTVIYRGIRFLWHEHHFLVPPSMWKKYIKVFSERMKNNPNNMFYNPVYQSDYLKWVQENEQIEEPINFDYNPLISVLIPVYNINRKYLSECIDSILNQTYSNLEVCLVDDASTNIETINTLKEYQEKDNRVKVKFRKKNGHISATTNDALAMAKGEFVALVDNDDLLTNNALYEVVKVLNENQEIDFIYSDEDKLDTKGRRRDPHFKPDFSPDTLMSLNYICHLAVIRKTIVEAVGGFEIGLEGAQDHDLFLKVTEKTNKIYHISKILYHWRMVEGSTSMTIDNKSYATDKGAIAIENALKRRKIKGHVEKDQASTYYRVVYEYDKEPLISIIIPTKDYADVLDACLSSLYDKTTYKNFEVIVINNRSEKKETFDLFEKYQEEHSNFKIVEADMEFNYSKINNLAVQEAKGEYIVLLNNDTEIITNNWLETMVGYAALPHIGTVGPKLLYPDTTVQHAGVILGLGGVASHAYIGRNRDELGMYGRLRVPYNYSAVTAACLMISRKKFEEVNELEEDLMVAYNDIDLNIKNLKNGYHNVFLPQVELFHHESKSRGLDTTSEKYKRFLKEEEYMYNKWGYELEHDKYYNSNFSKSMWFLLNKPLDEKKLKEQNKIKVKK